jgi:hypothetical protein
MPDLHHAMGVAAPPQTPATVVRGGGTSLFSLPEESGAETPHTSNVSVGTSITSVHTNSARRHGAMRPQLVLGQDGLQLRQSVHVVSSLLQKLSLACLELGELSSKREASKYVLVCDSIKKLYLQMVAVKREDALALMDTFYLESLPSSSCAMIAREVSADEEDFRSVPTQSRDSEVAILPPPITAAMLIGTSEHGGGTASFVDRMGNSRPFGGSFRREAVPNHQENDHQPIASRGMSMFSPSTEDMRSKASDCVPFEYDDLRRQVGSYDRDDLDESEERDGPCEDGYETQVDSVDWRQMYQNASLAATSLRSLGLQVGASGPSI